MEGYRDIQFLVAKKAGIGKGHIILDTGTGPAALLAIRLTGLVGKDGLVIAMDNEKEYIPNIKDAISKSGFPSQFSVLRLVSKAYIAIILEVSYGKGARAVSFARIWKYCCYGRGSC